MTVPDHCLPFLLIAGTDKYLFLKKTWSELKKSLTMRYIMKVHTIRIKKSRIMFLFFSLYN